MKKSYLLFIALFGLSLNVQSESIISVNAVNYPVWVERDQAIMSLAPGDELDNGDLIKTGSSGRAWLYMNDGSVIKLGQNAEFKVKKAAFVENEQGTVLDAAFNVLKGAFRFTTSFFQAERKVPHQVNMQIGAITAGVRGTDIWGRSTEKEDFVTLLEGAINVVADGGALPTRMEQPNTLYRKKVDQDAEPVSTMDQMLVNILALETELSKAEGIATVDGQYDLVLMSLMDGSLSADNMDRFRQQGYAVRKQFVTLDEQRYTRIMMSGFVSIEAAMNQAKQMEETFQLEGLWVKKFND